jgi:hypothetical protein
MKQKLVGLLEIEIDSDESGLSITQKCDQCDDSYIYVPAEYIDLFIQKLINSKDSNHGR